MANWPTDGQEKINEKIYQKVKVEAFAEWTSGSVREGEFRRNLKLIPLNDSSTDKDFGMMLKYSCHILLLL